MAEGQKVRYVGDDTLVGVGTVGKVVAAAGTTAQHVQWLDGLKVGSIDLVANEDVVPYRGAQQGQVASVAQQFEASLDAPSLLTVAVRETYDDTGEEGLVAALAEEGYLAPFSEYASSAIAQVAASLRGDPTFSLVLAQLDDFEAASLLSRVAVSLLNEEA